MKHTSLHKRDVTLSCFLEICCLHMHILCLELLGRTSENVLETHVVGRPCYKLPKLPTTPRQIYILTCLPEKWPWASKQTLGKAIYLMYQTFILGIPAAQLLVFGDVSKMPELSPSEALEMMRNRWNSRNTRLNMYKKTMKSTCLSIVPARLHSIFWNQETFICFSGITMAMRERAYDSCVSWCCKPGAPQVHSI